VLRDRLSLVLDQDFSSSGGIDFLVKVLNKVDRATEKTILESLDEDDPELADDNRKLMFVFEKSPCGRPLDPARAQGSGHQGLALALKGASDEVKERVYRNMSYVEPRCSRTTPICSARCGCARSRRRSSASCR